MVNPVPGSHPRKDDSSTCYAYPLVEYMEAKVLQEHGKKIQLSVQQVLDDPNLQMNGSMIIGPLLGGFVAMVGLLLPHVHQNIVTQAVVDAIEPEEKNAAMEKKAYPAVCGNIDCPKYGCPIPRFCVLCGFFGRSWKAHSVVLTGYNEEEIPYWEFRNNWGMKWAFEGYGKFAMSSGQDDEEDEGCIQDEEEHKGKKPEWYFEPKGILDIEAEAATGFLSEIEWIDEI